MRKYCNGSEIGRRTRAASRTGFALLWLFQTLALGAEGAISREYEIKAAFLFNFTRFMEWPVESFADPASPIVIGVIGTDPFGAELASVVQGRRVNGRALVARYISTEEDARAAHLLFVGLTREEDLARLMRAIEGFPVMTVGESAEFAAHGGTITFVRRGDKLRFEINTASAARAHVRISAQLEKLATVVRRSTPIREGACCAMSPSGAN
jgi:hypothetical protein